MSPSSGETERVPVWKWTYPRYRGRRPDRETPDPRTRRWVLTWLMLASALWGMSMQRSGVADRFGLLPILLVALVVVSFRAAFLHEDWMMTPPEDPDEPPGD